MSLNPHDQSIWFGVYDRFDEVSENAEVFDSSLWAEKQQLRVLQALDQLNSRSSIPAGAKSRDYPFIPFLSGLLTIRPHLRVLDYGGAMGQTYLEVLAKLPEAAEKLSYTIVETQTVVDAVPDKIRNLRGLRFLSTLDAANETMDVVHCGSVLQYIEDWKSFFMKIINTNQPDNFVLSDLLVGEIPSFVTAQRYYGRVTAVKCINIDEFLTFWQQTPYKLSYRAHYYPLSGEDYFPTHDLPASHRIKTACHLVFSKQNEPVVLARPFV